jgi:hypothetical protein
MCGCNLVPDSNQLLKNETTGNLNIDWVFTDIKILWLRSGKVDHTYNHSYSEGRDWEDCMQEACEIPSQQMNWV